MKGPPPPFRFVLNVLGVWVALRMCFLIYTPPALRGIAPLLFPGLPVEGQAIAAAPMPVPRAIPARLPAVAADPVAVRAAFERDVRMRTAEYALLLLPGNQATSRIIRAHAEAVARETEQARARAGFSPAFIPTPPLPPPADPMAPPAVATIRHWSGSAWAYLRDGSGPAPAATAGQLGGSQAGVRIAWAPAPDRVPIAVAARISAPIEGSRGLEAALGVDWQPLRHLPVRVSLNRRVGLDRGGRDAWELMAAGGVYAQPLPGGLRLDGYAQAGVVGARSRDGFVDGAVRIGKPVAIGPHDTATVTIGGGVWGAAQPRLARLDVGPSATLRLPIGPTGVTVAAEWRFRLAGDARPRSGPSLTLATDF